MTLVDTALVGVLQGTEGLSCTSIEYGELVIVRAMVRQRSLTERGLDHGGLQKAG